MKAILASVTCDSIVAHVRASNDRAREMGYWPRLGIVASRVAAVYVSAQH
jgi:hypothetical protein